MLISTKCHSLKSNIFFIRFYCHLQLISSSFYSIFFFHFHYYFCKSFSLHIFHTVVSAMQFKLYTETNQVQKWKKKTIIILMLFVLTCFGRGNYSKQSFNISKYYFGINSMREICFFCRSSLHLIVFDNIFSLFFFKKSNKNIICYSIVSIKIYAHEITHSNTHTRDINTKIKLIVYNKNLKWKNKT